MKKIRNIFEKYKVHRAALPLLCYGVAAALWLLCGLGGMVSDGIARASGRMSEQTLHAADFALVDLDAAHTGYNPETGVQTDVLVTTSGDPQMILEDVSAETVRTLRVYAGYEGTAREMCLYYTTAPDQPYSQDRRVFPAQQADGSYLYTLPRGTLYALRLDPCSPDENKTVTIRLEKITLNADLGGYLVPSWAQMFGFVLYPGLIAAALSWLAAVFAQFKRRKNGKN